MSEENEYLIKLLSDHWNYLQGVLHAHDTPQHDIDLAEFHYKASGRHFWKHAMEYRDEQTEKTVAAACRRLDRLQGEAPDTRASAHRQLLDGLRGED